jgi:hypothetical protein
MYQSSTVLTYLSDELTAHDLVTSEEFWFNFNVASLFFDSIPMSSSALLSNPRLRDLWSSSRDSASAIYSSGLLRPILMGSKSCVGEVAEGMIARGTIHHLGGAEELRRHAEDIDRATSTSNYAWVREDTFRECYATNYEKAIERIRQRNCWSSGSPIRAREKPGIKKLHEWAQKCAASSELWASSVHKLLDHGIRGLPPDTKNRLKMLAEVSYYEILRRLLDSCLTVAEPLLDLATLVSTADPVPVEESATVVERTELLECPLPFERLARLPLMNVLQLRGTDPFVGLRNALHQVRRGEVLLNQDIKAKVVECVDLLEIFTRSLNDAVDRREILQDMAKKSKYRSLRFFFNGLRLVAIRIGLSTGGPSVGLFLAAHGVGGDILRRLETRANPNRYSLPEPSGGDVVVNLIDGRNRPPGNSAAQDQRALQSRRTE